MKRILTTCITNLLFFIPFAWSQNIGIGTASPTGKLHVKGGANISQLTIDAHSTQGNTQPLIKLRMNNGTDLMWIHSDDPSNIFIGLNAGRTNTIGEFGLGEGNTFIGSNAGYTNTTGYRNTALGVSALYSNTSGHGNTAMGSNALLSNTTGYDNSANGYGALYSNTSGRDNVATGANALYYNTSGYENTAFGAQALQSNTMGNQNTGIGGSALLLNTTGAGNTAIGMDALRANTSGAFNTASGASALRSNTTGPRNTAIGIIALFSNTTGSDNVASGHAALYANTTGIDNTAYGTDALRANTTGNSNTAIGDQALRHITSNTGWANTGVGFETLKITTIASGNTAIGYHAGGTHDNSYDNTFLGNQADANGVYHSSTALGASAIINASDKVRIGSSGVGVIEGQVAYTWPSDGRFKENIQDDVQGLDFIMKLQPVSFNFNRLKFAQHVREPLTPTREKTLVDLSQIRTVGFIAQDVERIIQETGFISFDAVHAPTNNTDNYSLSYASFVVPLVKAVQELSAENTLLNGQVASLTSRMEDLEIKLALLQLQE